MGLVIGPGSIESGDVPRCIFVTSYLSELSICIDESDDLGKYNHHSPFYIKWRKKTPPVFKRGVLRCTGSDAVHCEYCVTAASLSVSDNVVHLDEQTGKVLAVAGDVVVDAA